MNAAQRIALEQALQSSDPFAAARIERPGHKFIRIVDKRTQGNLGLTFIVSLAPGSRWFDKAPADQTVELQDNTPPQAAAEHPQLAVIRNWQPGDHPWWIPLRPEPAVTPD